MMNRCVCDTSEGNFRTFLYLASLGAGLYRDRIPDIFMTQLSASVKQMLGNHLPVVKGIATRS